MTTINLTPRKEKVSICHSYEAIVTYIEKMKGYNCYDENGCQIENAMAQDIITRAIIFWGNDHIIESKIVNNCRVFLAKKMFLCGIVLR